jgi:uncharacterized protein (DUF58 family)
MAATLVLDTSASMSFPKAVSKYRYAMILSAALAHIVSSQGDAVGLVAGPRMIPARAGRHNLRALLAALSGVEASGRWNAAETVRRAAERLNRRGLLLVLSDFYDEEDATFNELKRAARMGHEVVLFQTMSREEVEFPYRRDFEFEDLEDRPIRFGECGPCAPRVHRRGSPPSSSDAGAGPAPKVSSIR